MNSRPALGQTITTTAYCHDRGTWPGPLQSVAPKVISLTTTVRRVTGALVTGWVSWGEALVTGWAKWGEVLIT